MEEIFYSDDGETLQQVAQRGCRCPLPGSVRGQDGWGFEQSGLAEGVPAPWQGCWNLMIFKVPSNTNHSMILRSLKMNLYYHPATVPVGQQDHPLSASMSTSVSPVVHP